MKFRWVGVGWCVVGALLAGVSADAQTREELDGTVDLLRHNWPAETYVSEWVGYMGFTAVTAREQASGEAALSGIGLAFDAGNARGMLTALEDYLAASPPDELAAMALYFYFNRVVDQAGAIPDPSVLDAQLPDWSLLAGPNSKFFMSYLHIDLAWQARAEGDAALEQAYFERVRSTAAQLIAEEPQAAVQVWNVYNYVLASLALGEASVADAVTTMRRVVATQDASVLTWICRYQLNTVPRYFPSIENETDDHLGTMAAGFDEAYMVDALNDPRVMGDVKAMLQLDAASVVSRTNTREAAIAAYDEVITEYGGCLEWTPRKAGRTIVNPSEYGVISMTRNNRATIRMEALKDDPDAYVAEMSAFIAEHPNSEHADRMLWRLARHREYLGDLEGAREAYRELAEEREYSKHSDDAETRIVSVDEAIARTR